MLIPVCTGKIHRCYVTEADLNYSGSITICPDLMEAAGLVAYQMVHINSVPTAQHWETYVIPGRPRQICLNGPPARLFQPGDQIIILGVALMDPKEYVSMMADGGWQSVFVDRDNRIMPKVIDCTVGLDGY